MTLARVDADGRIGATEATVDEERRAALDKLAPTLDFIARRLAAARQGGVDAFGPAAPIRPDPRESLFGPDEP